MAPRRDNLLYQQFSLRISACPMSACKHMHNSERSEWKPDGRQSRVGWMVEMV